jgi:hypothetical protein
MPNPTILPTADTHIDSAAATTNYGSAGGFDCRLLYIAGEKMERARALLQFQIPTEIPAAEVQFGFLRLYWTYIGASAAAKVFRVLRTWVEAQATWTIWSTGNNWTTAGCSSDGNDYTTTGAVAFTVPAVVGWQDIDITALVTDAITSRSGLLNLMLALDNENLGSNSGGTAASRDNSGLAAWCRAMLVIVRPPFGMPTVV